MSGNINTSSGGTFSSGGFIQQADLTAMLNPATPTNGPTQITYLDGGYSIGRSPGSTDDTKGGILVYAKQKYYGNGTTLHMVSNAAMFNSASQVGTTSNLAANVAVGDTTYTVVSSAGFAIGQYVIIGEGYATYDANEPGAWDFAKVIAIPSSMTIQVDRPSAYGFTLGATGGSSYVPQISNFVVNGVDTFVHDVVIDGFDFTCIADTPNNIKMSCGIGLRYAMNVTIRNCTGTNVGAGLVGLQYCKNVTIQDCHVLGCVAQQSSYGRAFSVSESRNVLLLNCSSANCEENHVFIEANSEVRAVNYLCINNFASRLNNTYCLFAVLGNSGFVIDGLTLEGVPCLLWDGSGGGAPYSRFLVRDLVSKVGGLPIIGDMKQIEGKITVGSTYEGDLYDSMTTIQQVIPYSGGSTAFSLPTGIYRRLRLIISDTTGIPGNGIYLASATGGGNRIDNVNGNEAQQGVLYDVGNMGMGPTGSGYQINSGASARTGTIYKTGTTSGTMTVILEYWPGS